MSDSPRLFIASGIFHPEAGGPATYLYELLPELAARRWDIRALTYGDGATDGYGYPLTRIPRRALPLRMADYARVASSNLSWANVIYQHTLGLPLVGPRRAPRVVKIVGDQAWERAIRKGWIPPTEDIDDFQTKRYGTVTNLQKAIRSREVCGMDGVIVPSEYLKQMVVGWGVPPERVQVIYNALPPDHVAPDVAQAEARKQLGLGDEPLLLTAARLTPWKGVNHIIAALHNVPHVRLLVAGDGDQLGALKRQTAETEMTDRVSFVGRVGRDRMPLYMKAADYVVLYSGYEGLSHTLLESLRVGTPVIASEKGGNPEVIQHGVNGLLVPYVDVVALSRAIFEAFQPGRRAAMAVHHEVGMERFDFRRMVEQTDATLRAYL